jgi:hypothetical protein
LPAPAAATVGMAAIICWNKSFWFCIFVFDRFDLGLLLHLGQFLASCCLLCLWLGFKHQQKGFVSHFPLLSAAIACCFLSPLSTMVLSSLYLLFSDEDCCSEFVFYLILLCFFFELFLRGSGSFLIPKYFISLVKLLNLSLRASSAAFRVF